MADPLTVSKDVADALGSLIDDEQELAAAARAAEGIVLARVGHLREVLDPDSPTVDARVQRCNRILRRMRALSAARRKAVAALDGANEPSAALVKFLRAALQEGVFLGSLGDGILSEAAAETLDRYAILFERLTGRRFEPVSEGS